MVGDAHDERLVPYVGLTDAEHRRSVDARTGTFVVEGTTAIRRALTSRFALRSVLVTPAKAVALDADLAAADVDVFVADLDVMRAVTGFDIHRGAVAVAERRPERSASELLADASAVVALEGVNDHVNLGAIARSAWALGLDGLLLDPTCADPLYRRCVRVSMGEVLHLPFARNPAWPRAAAGFEAAHFTTVALTPRGGAPDIRSVLGGLRSDRRVALVLGAEGPGLTDDALEAVDHVARIAVRAGVDSLNVGHAAAIAFHLLGRR